jgi:two-component system, LytTR family, sensor kinase
MQGMTFSQLTLWKEAMSFQADSEDSVRLDWRIVLISILGFWVFYAIVVSLRAGIMDFPSQGEMAVRRSYVSAVGIVLTILYWLSLRAADRRPLLARIIAAALLAIPVAIAIASANYYVFNVFDPMSLADVEEKLPPELKPTMTMEIADGAINRYFFLIAWASFYLALGFAKDVGAAERKASGFARAAQTAELRALRYQVNPHFLFNTLNSLSALVMKGEKALADAMIMNLSTFYRTSLASEPTEDVSLAEEIELQKLYLDIEAVRFPNRLSVAIDMPPDLADAAVPGLILQPLVENAIKHGVSQSTSPVSLSIRARVNGDQLVLTVANTGSGASRNAMTGLGGIGLANVRDRLAARFGDQASLDHSPLDSGGYTASISFPLVRHGR